MLRSLLAIFAGLLVGVTVVWLVELPGMLLYPLPAGINPFDKEAMEKHMATLPALGQAWGIMAWTAGALAGAWAAAFIARRAFLVHGLVIGVLFLAVIVVMVFSIPHPVWLAIVGLVAPLAAAWLGASLAARMARLRSGPLPYAMRDKNMAC